MLFISADPKQDQIRQKGFLKKLLSDVINALACVYCYFLRAERNGYPKKREKLQCSFVNCFSLRKAVKTRMDLFESFRISW